MRFVRHFFAAAMVVALVVALGFIWSRSGAASVVADDRAGYPPASATLDQTGTAPARTAARFDRRSADGLSLSNAGDLAQTLLVEGAIVVGVVAIDLMRRRRRLPVVRTRAGA